MSKHKKQLDLSEIGEPIDNNFQETDNSEVSLNLTNIINENALPIHKMINSIEDNIEQNDNNDNNDNNENDSYDYDYSEYNENESVNETENESVNDVNDTVNEIENKYDEIPRPQNIEVLHAQQLASKRDLVYKIQQLQQRLYDIELNPKNFTTADSLSELQSEYDRLTKIKHQKSTREWYRKILFGVTKGIEWANHKWDPVGLKLDGWSTDVASNIDEFDEIFDELSEKYGGSVTERMAPELRLVLLLLYSGMSYSISQTLVQDHSNRPEFTEIINKDPVLRERFLNAATEIQMEKAQPQVSNLLNSMKEIFTEKPQNTMRNFMNDLDNSELQVNELGL